jgi:hypothetical protein
VGAVQILQIQDEIDYIISNLEHMVEPHVVRNIKHLTYILGYFAIQKT